MVSPLAWRFSLSSFPDVPLSTQQPCLCSDPEPELCSLPWQHEPLPAWRRTMSQAAAKIITIPKILLISFTSGPARKGEQMLPFPLQVKLKMFFPVVKRWRYTAFNQFGSRKTNPGPQPFTNYGISSPNERIGPLKVPRNASSAARSLSVRP